MHTSPSIWVRYALTSDPAADRPALAGQDGLHHHLDHDAVDASRLDGRGLPSRARIRRARERRRGTSTSLPKTAAETVAKMPAWSRTGVARFPGASLSTRHSSIPFLDRSHPRRARRLRHAGPGHRSRPHRPSHGADDFYTGVQYGLDQTCNVDEAGRIHAGLPEYKGLQVFKANPPIVELLKQRGALLGRKIEHSYPHCWRCHNPVIFRATSSGSSRMERKDGAGTSAQPALEEIEQSEVGSGLGRGAHRQHGRDPARLVHLAPAHLGRSHRRLPLRGLQ